LLTTQFIDLKGLKAELALVGWLHTEIKCRLKELNADTITHPSTNRAQRTVTSLIRPTPLPLRNAARCQATLMIRTALHARCAIAVPVFNIFVYFSLLAESNGSITPVG